MHKALINYQKTIIMHIRCYANSIDNEDSQIETANNGDYFSASHSFPRLVFDAFNKEGITIPFNQIDVHIDK